MESAIVKNKNYLQGSSGADVLVLGSKHRLVMPGPLFFELLTTDPQARQRCFSKLPQAENPVELIDHIGLLLSHEMRTGSPAGRPSSHRLQMRFKFNARLREADYSLLHEAQQAIDEMAAQFDTEVDQLVDLSEQTPSLFPDILKGNAEAQRADHADIECLIADPSKMLDFYSVLESPDPSLPYPAIKTRPEEWALIRWLQVKMLFAVNLFMRYRGSLRASLSPGVLTRLEHDVHDAQILALGVLEGALATHEVKLRRWFRLLQPAGLLQPSDT